MATNFPTSLDTLPNPAPADEMDSASPGLLHTDQHANANDAIEALQAKVGANSSAVTTSHDYKLSAEGFAALMNARLVQGANVTITYNPGANTITIASAGGGGGGTIADGSYGDVVVSGTGTVITISAAAVTLSKMANMATASILGRVTASTGVPEVLSAAQVKTLLAIVKADVGLGSVDNTADSAKPVSTLTQAALDLKANAANPAFTGTPTGITATHVGLGNVNNTSDASKPISTLQQAGLDLKANLASPTLTGVPAAPTAAPGTNTTQLATTAFANAAATAAAAALVASAPGALDTLDELAAALGDDPNFATTVTNAIALKAPLASPALTGTPTAPTAAPGTNTTQLATTAFTTAAVAAAGGGGVTVQDEGSPLTTVATTINFVGSGVTASGAGAVKTVTINSGGDALVANPLSQFAPTTSLQLKNNISDETGSGALVFADSPALAGTPTAPTAAAATNTTQVATTAHVFAERSNAATLTNKTHTAPVINGAVTGTATLPATVTMLATPSPADNSLKIATTAYADAIAALKANLASPTFTGTPAAPTATAGTNTTQLATTAFVTTADNLKAPLASPALTGTPTAPTAAPGTNTTQLASTAFVAAAVAAGSGAITVQEEGSPLTTGATTLNFVGAGVTATGAGATKTITVNAGGDVTLNGAQTLTNKYLGDSGSVIYGGQANVAGMAMYPRADSAANYVTHNPVLRNTEIAWEYDTGGAKMGDGVTAYASLDYFILPNYGILAPVVLGAGPTNITHAAHANRSAVSRQPALANFVFANAATSGAIQGSLVAISIRGAGHGVATGTIYADPGFKLWAKPGESIIAEFDAVADAWFSKTPDIAPSPGTEPSFFYQAQAGSATPLAIGLTAPSAYDSSTLSLRPLTTTTKYTHQHRVAYAGAAAANEGAGFILSTNSPFRAPTAAIPYGFKVRFIAAGADANAAGFMIIGLITGNHIVTTEPSVDVNCLMVAHDSSDTQFKIMHTDASGPANKLPINGGSGFPAHTNAADLIDTGITFRSDGTGRWALVTVRHLISNSVHTELITTDLPAEGSTLIAGIMRGSLNSGTPAAPTLEWSYFGAGMFA